MWFIGFDLKAIAFDLVIFLGTVIHSLKARIEYRRLEEPVKLVAPPP